MSAWYDLIAKFYDSFSTRTYRKSRYALVDRMDLQPGDNVFLVGCGTGLLFHLIQDRIGKSGMIVGLDASEKMLLQAKKKINVFGWENVHLIFADARNISSDLIHENVGRKVVFDHTIGELSV